MKEIADEPQANPSGARSNKDRTLGDGRLSGALSGSRESESFGHTPVQTAFEATTQEAFMALLWALSTPGEIQHLPAGDEAFAVMGETLLDLETRFYTPETALRERLTQTGAHHTEAHEADYLFFPHWKGETPALLAGAKRGDALYPDRAATVILSAEFSGQTRTLTGPGINGSRDIALSVPEVFWTLRERAIHYPLGWDVFLVNGNQVMGLPRTTKVGGTK